MTENELKVHVNRMVESFENDDLSFAMKVARPGSDPKMVEMGYHKARYACGKVSDAKRLESQQWLAERGLRDLNTRPVKVGDPLPGLSP